ncbi:MAG: hypothetical protein GY729_12325 [Desulfobacteraceae bacterium]|nr:hypothetical protein [Desulfobacteraceae bacterium]
MIIFQSSIQKLVKEIRQLSSKDLAPGDPLFRIEEKNHPGLKHLVYAINEMTDHCLGLKDKKTSDTIPLSSDLSQEQKILSAFISKLPEAIVICDVNGIILLHNNQAKQYLLFEENLRNQSISFIGTSIMLHLGKSMIEHALDDINQSLTRHAAQIVSHFIFQLNNLILQAQIAPVLNSSGQFAGFIVILADITGQNHAETQIELLLQTLSKTARSPLSSIRAAVEAMKAFPKMDSTRQQEFINIIHKESIVLSDMLNGVSDSYASLIKAKISLKRILTKTLLKTIARRARDKLQILFELNTAMEKQRIFIKADQYSFILSVLFILDRLKETTRSSSFHCTLKTENKIALVDILWKGDPVKPETIKKWEDQPIDDQPRTTPLTLKEILNHHHGTIWAYTKTKETGHMPYVRIFIPADEQKSLPPPAPISILSESQTQLSDLKLFNAASQTPDLDNRLLAELSYASLIREINHAEAIEQIIGKHSQLPRLIHSMITGGTKIRTVTWLITALSDTILNKIISFAIDELGPAPVPFAFITLGSEGRKEQTLKTDQDNALIFEDTGSIADEKKAQKYFLNLGEKVCTWLDQAGYDYCGGNIMAKNPKWCQSISKWKSYFSQWIYEATPKDLFHTSIFFDFRFAYGNKDLTDSLSRHLFASLSGWSGFFRNMTQNAVYFKPPIGIFQNFLVEKKGEHKNCLNIKMAQLPFIEFARIYALKHHIKETNTQDRLYQLFLKKTITRNEYNEIEQAYSFMMQLRFMGQINRILGDQLKAHNYIHPKKMSSIEKRMLKEVLKKAKELQSKLSLDFTGTSVSE